MNWKDYSLENCAEFVLEKQIYFSNKEQTFIALLTSKKEWTNFGKE